MTKKATVQNSKLASFFTSLKSAAVKTASWFQSTEAERKFWMTHVVVFGTLIFLNLLVYIFVPPLRWSDNGPVLVHFGALMSGLVFFYIAVASWRFESQIGPDEMGVFIRFGQALHVRDSGLPFAARGFFRIETLKISFNQKQFPAEDHLIYKGDMKDAELLPPGLKPPIRISFSENIKNAEEAAMKLGAKEIEVLDLHKCSLPEGKHWSDFTYSELNAMEARKNDNDIATTTFSTVVPDDGLTRRVTAEILLIVAFRVEKQSVIDFLQKVGSVPEAMRQIEDEMVSVLNRLLPKMSLSQARENLTWINAHLYLGVLKRTMGWGIHLDRAYAKDIPLHHTLNRAISNLTEAGFQGKADKELAIRKGEGAAEAARLLEENTLVGRAAGQAEMRKVLEVSGENILAAETLRDVGQQGNLVILGTEGVAQAAALAGAMFKAGDKKPASPTTPTATPDKPKD